MGLSASAGAQSASARVEVPKAYEPPPGMCRVWLPDVPPVQQPAPTDCRSAVRGKPVNATVVYGPDPKRTSFTPDDWVRPRVGGAFAARDDDRGPEVSGDGDAVPALPSMRAAVLWTEGQTPADMTRWLGTQLVSARFQMPPRGAAPERVQWVDADNRVVQIWIDRNGDGRADRVEIFSKDGARVRVVGQ